MAPETIQLALQKSVSKLTGSSDAPRIDADRLMLEVLDKDESSWLAAHGEELLTGYQWDRYQQLVDRRRMGEPLAYILGEWGFYGRTFEVNSNVLVPRPDTEELVDKALELTDLMSATFEKGIVVADVGTGSGCIAVTLLKESPHIDHVYATDISVEALEVAGRNAKKHGVLDRITFLKGDMMHPLINLGIDLVVSNPPYVPTNELDVAPSVETRGLGFEPRWALDGGSDGLEFVNQIKRQRIPSVIETVGGEVEVFC